MSSKRDDITVGGIKRYLSQGFTRQQIAKMYKCSSATIDKRLRACDEDFVKQAPGSKKKTTI